MKLAKLLNIALVALIGTACTSIDSENIPTDSMTANIKISVHDSGNTDVQATLRIEDSALTYLDLTGGEHLTATMGGRTTRLVPGFFDYRGFLSDGLAGHQVRIGLNRNQYDDAHDSYATVPTPFTLRVTTHPNEYDDTIELRWNDRTREKTRIKADGHCIRDEEWKFQSWNDTGRLTMAMSQLPIRSSWSGRECTIELTVERCRDGRLDPHFYGGTIEACQVRSDYIQIYK